MYATNTYLEQILMPIWDKCDQYREIHLLMLSTVLYMVEIFFQENPQKPQHIYFHSIDEWNSYLRLDVYILLYQKRFLLFLYI